jgi:hypothetical protein
VWHGFADRQGRSLFGIDCDTRRVHKNLGGHKVAKKKKATAKKKASTKKRAKKKKAKK